MITLTPGMKIFVCLDCVDFRKGIDGLASLCRQKLQNDPMSGILFVFRNRKKTTIRLLIYDGQGFWLCSKRLSKGTFKWWPQKTSTIEAKDMQALLWNGNPELAKFSEDWKKI